MAGGQAHGLIEHMTAMFREWLTACGGSRPGRSRSRRSLALTLGGLVLRAILLLAISAVGLLRKQAEQQALAQVQLAGVAAREEIRRSGEDNLTAARVLAARQTLQRLIRSGNRAQLELYLRRACEHRRPHPARSTVGSTRRSTQPNSSGPMRWKPVRSRGIASCVAPRWRPTAC